MIKFNSFERNNNAKIVTMRNLHNILMNMGGA